MQHYCSFALVLLCLAASGPRAQILINEFAPKGPEWIELHNPADTTVAVQGWTVDDGNPSHADTLDVTWGVSSLLPHAHVSHQPVNGWDLGNDGEWVILRNAEGAAVDSVAYGIKGPAPLAPSGWSCARRPDGAVGGTMAADWDIDPTPTPGSANDVPGASALGTSLVVNEINPTPEVPGAPDSLELFNPTEQDVNVAGWLISDGDDVDTLGTGIVPPGGYLVLAQDAADGFSFDFTANDVCYLWTDGFVRVDQMGWAGHADQYSLQRCPDGAGPHDGFGWISSGGGSTLFDLPSTWGGPNPVPAPPVGDLRLTLLGPTTAELTWTPSPEALSYNIYRTEQWYFSGQESLWVSVAAPPCEVTTGIGNPFLDCAYLVRAVGPTGESAPSNRVGEIDAFWDTP